MSYQPGEMLLNKYRVERLIGRGAFAEVYLARHIELNSLRALKVLRKDARGLGSSDFQDYEDRFVLEAQLGAMFDHPNLVRVYDFEHELDTLILVMEYCPGGSLADRHLAARKAGNGQLALEQVLQMANELAQGLAALHQKDLVHRDLKPNNILFDAQGRAKVADLGLAQTPGGLSQRSILGSLAPNHPGTPGYMSPEQENQTAYLRSTSDVYALGLILFESLSGRNYSNLKPGTRLRSLRPDCPTWLDELVGRMLAKDPEQRPWDGSEVLELLEQRHPKDFPGKLDVVVGESTFKETQENESGNADITGPKMYTGNEPPETANLGDTWRSPVDGMLLAYIPAGEFEMGSEDGDDDETPVHTVYLDAFWMDTTPVTNAMFKRFVEKTGYQTTAEIEGWGGVFQIKSKRWEETKGANWQHPNGPGTTINEKLDHPVIQVSWDDAQAYCEWAERRLPTEAEWEKAARGTDGRTFPWGNKAPNGKLANFADRSLAVDWADMNLNDGYQFTAPVGSYQQGKSPYGLLDMAGNVWEWVQDWYSETYYANSPGKNPIGPFRGDYRALRGGSWYDDQWLLRAASRSYDKPDVCDNSNGFRCAR